MKIIMPIKITRENLKFEVGRLLVIDEDNPLDDHRYEIVNGQGDADNDSFLIEKQDDLDVLVSNGLFDYEEKNLLYVRLRAIDKSDPSIFREQEFIINIRDRNEPISSISLSNDVVDEGINVGTVIGRFSVEDEDYNDSYSYSLITVPDGISQTQDDGNGYFRIDEDRLVLKEPISHSGLTSGYTTYYIYVSAEDGINSKEQPFYIYVCDLNAPPTAIYLR